jgi:hypothetical protein
MTNKQRVSAAVAIGVLVASCGRAQAQGLGTKEFRFGTKTVSVEAEEPPLVIPSINADLISAISQAGSSHGAAEEYAELGGVLFTGMFDYGSTVRCLTDGSCREGNPLVHWAITNGEWSFAASKSVAIFGVAWAVHWLHDHDHPWLARLVAGSASGLWGWAAASNARIGR